jgi:hypothetical protein
MIERALERLAPTPWNIKPLSTSRGVRVRDRNDRTLFLCEDPALAEAIVEIINDQDAVITRIERLQEIALSLRDRLTGDGSTEDGTSRARNQHDDPPDE